MAHEGPLSEYLGTGEVSRMLNISQSAVRRLYYRGTLPGIRKAAQIFFKRDAVRALLDDKAFQKRRRLPRWVDTETPSIFDGDVPSGVSNG